MKIAFNPSTVAALIAPPNNKDITFDLRGRNIFARGVKFYGTDTNTWRDIKINNVSIGSHTLDLRNGSNTTLTNIDGVVTINSTWRPVVDNLTSDSTTSSLSAKQGKVLKALIDGKSNSDHNHDGRYVRYYAVTTLDCNNLAAGLTAARISATNAAHTNHSAYLYISDVGTPFQIQIPDSSIPYIYKRYYGSGGWSGWFKLNAGYADSAGSVAWANITGKPSSYTPSAHTHAWNSLTHSSTTENQAILTNGKANGWKLLTLNIARWDNAANNAHSHANKSVLDGITSALVNSWNTAYNFVSNITGTDTDKVINKWEEIVNFLAGITEDNKLNTLLNSKLSVYELADNTNVGTIKNNGIYYSTTDASSGTLINSPFNTGFAFINMTSYDGGDDLRRSRLAFNAYGEIKVSDDRGLANTAETWYNVLTSKNSGINGSTIKLNGTSITVYSSGTADSRYVKKSGDTMLGALNFANGTWNLVGDDSYMGDCNVSGHFGIKAANTTYPGIAFFNNSGAHLGNLTAYNGNIKYGAYSLRFLDNGNTSVGASTWTNPFSDYNSNAVADGQAICVWGQSSLLSNLATDTGDMTLWLRRVNAKVATLNMVLDGEYYAKGNLRLAHVSEIPSSLKNPYALTISLNGTSQGPYDGSAAKNINITPGSIGAAVSNHSHDYLVVNAADNKSFNSAYHNFLVLYAGGSNGITGKPANVDAFGLFKFRAASGWSGQMLLANGGSLYIRSSEDAKMTNTLAWKTILDSSNYSGILDSRYYTESEVNSLLSNKLNTSNFNWTNLPGKLVAGNEFNIVNSGFNEELWFNYLPINNRNSTATVRSYHFGNGNKGLATLNASGFIKSNSNNNYVLLGGGGHKLESALNVANADTLDGYHASNFVRAGNFESADLNKLDTYSFIKSVNSTNKDTSPKGNIGWYNVILAVHRNGASDGPGYIGLIALGMTVNTDDMFFRGKRTDPWKTVIHSGNIANLSVKYATNAGNADTVDGIHAVKFPYINSSNIWRVYGNSAANALADNTTGLSAWAFGEGRNYNNSYLGILKPFKDTCGITSHGTIAVFGQGDTHMGIAVDYGFANFQVFGGNADKIVWRKKVAFTDSNVASATKLQTPRSIWGQSFDGTGNVSGSLSGVGHIQFSADNSYSIGTTTSEAAHTYTRQVWARHLNASRVYTGDTNLYIGYSNTAQVKFYSGTQQSGNGSNERMTILTNGNIGIGTVSPIEKLDVHGNIRATGQLYLPTNGNYNAILMGDDCWMGDCNIGDVIGLSGRNNANAGGIKFGKGGMYIGYNGSNHYSSGTSLWSNFNADLLDGVHLNGIFTGFSYAQSRLTATIGTVSKTVNVTGSYPSIGGVTMNTIASYGNCMGMADLASSNSNVNPNNLTSWHHFINMSYNTESTNMWLTLFAIKAGTTEVWVRSRAGGSISDSSAWAAPWVRLARITDNVASATNAYHLRINSANTWSTWYWAGLSGLPSWLWGSNDGTNCYVWNPSNFRVAYAASAGNAETLGGMPKNYGQAPFNTIPCIGGDGVMEIGRYIDYHYDNSGKYDFSTRLLATGNYKNVVSLPSASGTLALINDINNYYWANVKISTSSSTTTSPTVSNLTATSSIRMSNILLEHTDEINNITNGGIHLNYRNSGNVSLCYGGGNVGIGTTTPFYKLDVNGLVRASGFIHKDHSINDAVLLAGGSYMIYKTASTSWSTAILFGKYVWLTILMYNTYSGVQIIPGDISKPTKNIYVYGASSDRGISIWRISTDGTIHLEEGISSVTHLYATICYVAS